MNASCKPLNAVLSVPKWHWVAFEIVSVMANNAAGKMSRAIATITFQFLVLIWTRQVKQVNRVYQVR